MTNKELSDAIERVEALRDIALDSRYSDEFVGNAFRARLNAIPKPTYRAALQPKEPT